MKKLAAILLCAVLLTGCGAASKAPEAVSSAADTAAAAETASAVSAAATPVPTATPFPAELDPLTGLARQDTTPWRPAAVTISNAAAATRQWGLADAEIVMEALSVGKSTDLCLWYSSLSAVPMVGPVTQGNDVFWQFALPENAIPVQKGSSLYAENLLNCYGVQPLDAMYLGVNCFDFEHSIPGVADAYCWYTSGAALQRGLDSYALAAQGATAPLGCFGTPAAGSAVQSITIAYSDASATVLSWDAASGLWGMSRGGAPQCDATTGAQAAFSNVLVLYASAGVKDDGYTRDYALSGGTGLYLTGGTWQAIRWSKGATGAPLMLTDTSGNSLKLNTGKTYVGIVSLDEYDNFKIEGSGDAASSVSVSAGDAASESAAEAAGE